MVCLGVFVVIEVRFGSVSFVAMSSKLSNIDWSLKGLYIDWPFERSVY